MLAVLSARFCLLLLPLQLLLLLLLGYHYNHPLLRSRYNQLEGLCGGDLAFEHNPHLECLLLSHNKLESLPAEVTLCRFV
jgi:hypothetical protein